MSPEPEDATTSSAFQAPGPTVSTPSTSSTPSPSTQDAALQAVQKLASFDDDEEVQTLQYQRALDMVRAQSNLLNHGGRNPDHPQLEQSGPLDADGLIIEESSDGMSIDVQVPSIDAPTSQASTTNEADGEGLRAARKGVMNYLLEPLEQLRNIEKYKGSGCFQDDGLFYCPECPEYWHNPSWLHKNRFKLKAGLLRHLKMVHTEWTTLERDAAYKTPEGNCINHLVVVVILFLPARTLALILKTLVLFDFLECPMLDPHVPSKQVKKKKKKNDSDYSDEEEASDAEPGPSKQVKKKKKKNDSDYSDEEEASDAETGPSKQVKKKKKKNDSDYSDEEEASEAEPGSLPEEEDKDEEKTATRKRKRTKKIKDYRKPQSKPQTSTEKKKAKIEEPIDMEMVTCALAVAQFTQTKTLEHQLALARTALRNMNERITPTDTQISIAEKDEIDSLCKAKQQLETQNQELDALRNTLAEREKHGPTKVATTGGAPTPTRNGRPVFACLDGVLPQYPRQSFPTYPPYQPQQFPAHPQSHPQHDANRFQDSHPLMYPQANLQHSAYAESTYEEIAYNDPAYGGDFANNDPTYGGDFAMPTSEGMDMDDYSYHY
ncbi:hypothetical protein GGX14DRAFT_554376 [Mycena pura]|uniref:Uncharacterized protein n=1 Tax=Mycena pura TaxID=153505 RepID=A0AAD7E524_9AGAR|nr:hypothetical protein GGX14DRAFT_554376 [Mycena pura]